MNAEKLNDIKGLLQCIMFCKVTLPRITLYNVNAKLNTMYNTFAFYVTYLGIGVIAVINLIINI